MTGVLIRDSLTQRHTKRMSCEDEDRDQGDASTSQGMPKIASKAPEASMEQNVPHSSQKEPMQLTPWSHASSFQNVRQ